MFKNQFYVCEFFCTVLQTLSTANGQTIQMAASQLGPQTLVVPCAATNQRQQPQPKQEIQIAVSLAQLQQHSDQQVSMFCVLLSA